MGRQAAVIRRARALVVGRWIGVLVLAMLLAFELGRRPSPLLGVALGVAALVALVNLVQYRLTAAGRGRDVRSCGRLLLGLDTLLILVAVVALAQSSSGEFWVLLGWMPVEGVLAEGTAAGIVAGAAALAGLALYGIVERHGPPAFTPQDELFMHGLNLVGATLVMVAIERTMARGERAAALRTAELEAAARHEAGIRQEFQALSTVVLAGIAHPGDLDGVLLAMTSAVARSLDLPNMAIFLLDGPERLRCRAWFGDWQGTTALTFPVGRGSIVGVVAASGEAVLLTDHPEQHPDYFSGIPASRSEMCVPLRFAQRTLGVVNVESAKPNAFDEQDLHRLQRLADQMAIVVDNALLVAKERALAGRESAARREIEAVNRAVVVSLEEGGSFEDKLDRMLAEVAKALGYETLCFVTGDPDGRLRVRGAHGFPPELVRSRPVGRTGGITSQVLDTGQPYLSGIARGDRVNWRPGTVSELAVPVQVQGRTLGVLNAETSRPGAFGDGDVAQLTRIADQLAIVIERARLSEQEEQTVARLQELDRMKDDFVAMTSHELRTPLTVIRGFTRTLLRPDLDLDDEQHRHFIEVIDRQTARLARLVEDLLLVSRMQSGTLEVTDQVEDPARLLAEYAEEWAAEPGTVELELDDDLPLIRTDPDRLAQIVRNLVDNGLRYGAGSPVRVSAARAGGDLEIEVSDQGPGIPADQLPHVFERFRQAGSSAEHRAGIGLGLYITRQLVTALAGSIEVSSAPGQGATFRVRLPGVPAGGPEQPARAALRASRG